VLNEWAGSSWIRCGLEDGKGSLLGRELEPRVVEMIERDVGGRREVFGPEEGSGPSVQDEVGTTGAEEGSDCLKKSVFSWWTHGSGCVVVAKKKKKKKSILAHGLAMSI
jgi:hypothetical protein